MGQILIVAQTIAPLLMIILLGVLARKKQLLSANDVQGMQEFAIKFGLPCVVFNAIISARIGAESLGSMALLFPFLLIATVGGFIARKKFLPYYNLPLLLCAHEVGMLGLPLFILLFGTEHTYRLSMLDLTQAIFIYPTIAILSTKNQGRTSVAQFMKDLFSSPLLVICLLSLVLNLSGISAWLFEIGVGNVLTACTSFLAQPVGAIMIFCVGYNFSLNRKYRPEIFKVSLLHFCYYASACILIQLGLLLIPGVDAMTRWAVLMFTTLPPSFTVPSFGREESDFAVTSGVCSILTAVYLLIFCVAAAIVS